MDRLKYKTVQTVYRVRNHLLSGNIKENVSIHKGEEYNIKI